MARPRKEGIEFSGWDVLVFEDPKIENLVDAHGLDGFAVYFYLCQRAYGLYGYYLPWSTMDAAGVARRIGGGLNGARIDEIVGTCVDLELFHEGLFSSEGILTSRALQRGFEVVLRKRKGRRIIEKYWLIELPPDDRGKAEESIQE